MNRLLIILVALLGLTACTPHAHHHSHRKPHHATKQVKVSHLADGRVLYRDDSGDLWFYMYLMQSNSSVTPVYVDNARSFGYYSTRNLSSLPSGGAWVSAKSLPPEELKEEVENPETQEVEVATETDAQGGLMEPAEVEAESMNESMSGDDSHDGGDSTAGDADSDAGSSSSSDSGSSGGDSGGGGGDSGGGGGSSD